MRTTSRLTLIGLVSAALAIGALALAAPASANEATLPAVTASLPIQSAGTAPTTAPPPEEPQTSEQSSSKWKGGAARDLESGTWRATITSDGMTILLGQYGTEKEARRAGRKAARELNGVMDGPGCDPPFILC